VHLPKKEKTKKTKTWLPRSSSTSSSGWRRIQIWKRRGNDELKAINEIDGKIRQEEDLSESSSCRSQKVRKIT
jgi:hypothetical protein